ncbi:hypothetical protein [Azospirillum sp.]|uniref:hypothetical protein n=1 Tax=Azospirillum sp. TaxID=34012 RepID=UPI003D727C1B
MAHSEVVSGMVKALGPASPSGRGKRYAWLELAGRRGTVMLRNVVVGPNVSAHLAAGADGTFLVQHGARGCALAAVKVSSSYAEDRNLLLAEGLAIAVGVGALGLPAAFATWTAFGTGEVTGVPVVLFGLAAVLVFSRFGPLSEGDYVDFRKGS